MKKLIYSITAIAPISVIALAGSCQSKVKKDATNVINSAQNIINQLNADAWKNNNEIKEAREKLQNKINEVQSEINKKDSKDESIIELKNQLISITLQAQNVWNFRQNYTIAENLVKSTQKAIMENMINDAQRVEDIKHLIEQAQQVLNKHNKVVSINTSNEDAKLAIAELQSIINKLREI